MSEPDAAAVQTAILNYVGGKLTSEGTLHVEVRPFEPVTWPPESNEVKGEVVLSVPRMGNGSRLGEASKIVREGLASGEIDTGDYTVTEASESSPFNEQHPDLGLLLSTSVFFTVEPRTGN